MTFDYLRVAKAAAVLAMATCVCLLLLDARALVKAQNGVAQREATATLDLADRHLKQIEQDLRLREDAGLDEIKAIHASADQQLTGLRTTVDARLGDTLASYNTTERDANARLAELTGTVAGLRADLKPSLDHVNSITAHVDDALPAFTDCAYFDADGVPIGGNPDCLFNRFQGVTKAFEQAAVNTSAMTKDFRGALPQMLVTVQKVGDNSDAATAKTVAAAEESRRLLHNLAENTTPLPKWIRYPAQVIGLMGSAAVPVVTIEKLATVK